MKQQFILKDDCSTKDFRLISPNLMILFASVLLFADKNGLPIVVTSIISDRIDVISQSQTHASGRAIDISTKGWSDAKVWELQQLLDKKHSDIAAISASDLKPRPSVHHNYLSQGKHLHLQVRH